MPISNQPVNNPFHLSQLLDAGANLSLDKQGKVQVQGSMAHFFQKIGDCFRSQTSLNARAMALDSAIARRLAEGALSSPSAPVSAPTKNTMPDALTYLQLAHDYAETIAGDLLTGLPDSEYQRALESLHAYIDSYEGQSALSQGTGIEHLQEVLTEKLLEPLDTHTETATSVSQPPVPPQESTRRTMILNALPDLMEPYRDSLPPEMLRELVGYIEKGIQAGETRMTSIITAGTNEESLSLLADFIEQRSRQIQGFSEVPFPAPTRTTPSERHGPQKAEDLTPGTIFKQGTNTCFMMSVVNSLMLSEAGRARLASLLAQEGRLTLPDGTQVPLETKEQGFSAFEQTLGKVYGPRDSGWHLATQGSEEIIAKILGLRSRGSSELDFRATPYLSKTFWKEIGTHLHNGDNVVLFSGSQTRTASGGHYMAVSGTYINNDDFGLVVHDSLSGTQRQISLASIQLSGPSLLHASFYHLPDPPTM